MKTQQQLEFYPIELGLPEYGTECVIKISGLYGTAIYNHEGVWVNENYEWFDPKDITEWIPIIELSCLPTYQRCPA